mmetsp:Transcript_125118/g.339802  ORF Transcript_125118/g.339802 Transcript_125118/m.339802 type:complete len:413 (-) Transcript_125118:256-1494(-)
MAVASLTDASSALMLFSVSAISSASAAMFSSALAIAVSVSAATCSSSFFLSSVESNVATQYSFLSASSSPSFFSEATMSSIMPMIFSKPTFFPRRASTRKSRRARRGPVPWARCRRLTARARRSAPRTRTCRRLALGAGSVFLNNSRASSSLRSLMTSARARSSSERVLLRSSHSPVFVEQPFSSSARNCWSSARDSCVSARSFCISTMATPSSPIRRVLVSTDSVQALISFVLAFTSSSKVAMAFSSVSVASAKDLDMSSESCLRMPVICPLWGAYSPDWPPERNARIACLSSSSMSAREVASLFKRCARSVCSREPAMPFSRAATALLMASMLASDSALNAAKVAASFSLIAVASATASLASARSTCACFSASSSCAFCSWELSMSDVSCGALVWAALMAPVSSPPDVLQ